METHNQKEIDTALQSGAQIIGVNNRDLKTFQVDIRASACLVKFIPDNLIKVSESGITTETDSKYIKSLGFDAALIGTVFSKSGDISQALSRFLV